MVCVSGDIIRYCIVNDLGPDYTCSAAVDIAVGIG